MAKRIWQHAVKLQNKKKKKKKKWKQQNNVDYKTIIKKCKSIIQVFSIKSGLNLIRQFKLRAFEVI